MSNNLTDNKKTKERKFYKCVGKRLIDIAICVGFSLLFWWVYLIIAGLVKLNMGSPVLYKSERMGKGEKPVQLYKFRSMTNDVDETGVLLSGDQRLTKFGRLLRSTSLDELPSLINVLRGDMSIVGPRPLLMKYQPYYYEHERVRHNVRPGLTGWAQVNGRNAVSWEEKFKLDIEYVEKMSFWFDIKIIFLTAYKVVKRSDIIYDNKKEKSLYIVREHMVEREMEYGKNG